MGYGFFFSSRRRHTRSKRDWSSDVCSSDLAPDRSRTRARRPAPRRGSNSADSAAPTATPDRKSVVWGKSVDLGGGRIHKKETYHNELVHALSIINTRYHESMSEASHGCGCT